MDRFHSIPSSYPTINTRKIQLDHCTFYSLRKNTARTASSRNLFFIYNTYIPVPADLWVESRRCSCAPCPSPAAPSGPSATQGTPCRGRAPPPRRTPSSRPWSEGPPRGWHRRSGRSGVSCEALGKQGLNQLLTKLSQISTRLHNFNLTKSEAAKHDDGAVFLCEAPRDGEGLHDVGHVPSGHVLDRLIVRRNSI